MERSIELWTVEQLQQKYGQIHFPEYQRDPNVWSRDAKQRLIDSMMREFDIAPLYLYTRENDVIDCVDGRQRIGAIMSFLGINERDSHKGSSSGSSMNCMTKMRIRSESWIDRRFRK